ncbi:hypothetical protein JCM21900_004371 [Sporobolomyces salmonicolor]
MLPMPSAPPSSSSASSSALSPSSRPETDRDLEHYLLLLLSDSNLPTGGFVASSGLESWAQHGYLSSSSPSTAADLLAFVQHSLHSYARLNAPLLRRAHAAVRRLRADTDTRRAQGTAARVLDEALGQVRAVDGLCSALALNHVARRASVAQGGALLALYARAFAPPPGTGEEGERNVCAFVERYRGLIRSQGGERSGCRGHQTAAFGVLTAAVGLSEAPALSLFLFLQARSLLSSAVRLNLLGPYLAHRLLLWDVRGIVDEALKAVSPESPPEQTAETGEGEKTGTAEEREEEDWWTSDPAWQLLDERTRPGQQRANGLEPVTTWPLGEIVASRHDQLFTKVFNS